MEKAGDTITDQIAIVSTAEEAIIEASDEEAISP